MVKLVGRRTGVVVDTDDLQQDGAFDDLDAFWAAAAQPAWDNDGQDVAQAPERRRSSVSFAGSVDALEALDSPPAFGHDDDDDLPQSPMNDSDGEEVVARQARTPDSRRRPYEPPQPDPSAEGLRRSRRKTRRSIHSDLEALRQGADHARRRVDLALLGHELEANLRELLQDILVDRVHEVWRPHERQIVRNRPRRATLVLVLDDDAACRLERRIGASEDLLDTNNEARAAVAAGALLHALHRVVAHPHDTAVTPAVAPRDGLAVTLETAPEPRLRESPPPRRRAHGTTMGSWRRTRAR